MPNSEHVGMKLIEVRFLSLLSHLALLAASSLGSVPNVRAMLTAKDLRLRLEPSVKTESSCVGTEAHPCSYVANTALGDLLDDYMTEFNVLLGFSVFCLLIELFGVLYGASVFSPSCSLLSVSLHISGVFGMLGFLLDGWPSGHMLPLFLLFCLIPALGELSATSFAVFVKWNSRTFRSRRKVYRHFCHDVLELFGRSQNDEDANSRGEPRERDPLLTNDDTENVDTKGNSGQGNADEENTTTDATTGGGGGLRRRMKKPRKRKDSEGGVEMTSTNSAERNSNVDDEDGSQQGVETKIRRVDDSRL
eukprot:g6356.t1